MGLPNVTPALSMFNLDVRACRGRLPLAWQPTSQRALRVTRNAGGRLDGVCKGESARPTALSRTSLVRLAATTGATEDGGDGPKFGGWASAHTVV